MIVIFTSLFLFGVISKLLDKWPKCSRGALHDWVIFVSGNGYDWDEYRCIHCKKERGPCVTKPFQHKIDPNRAIVDCKTFGHFWTPALIEGRLSATDVNVDYVLTLEK